MLIFFIWVLLRAQNEGDAERREAAAEMEARAQALLEEYQDTATGRVKQLSSEHTTARRALKALKQAANADKAARAMALLEGLPDKPRKVCALVCVRVRVIQCS